MIKSDNINIYKDWKIVKKIEINRKLEREIDAIIGKRIYVKSENNSSSYQKKRKSIFRKDKRK
ncbi:MAG: hypothetical protein ACTSSN_04860 [Candidatus Heimdallarchaeaceae archaeon]